MKTTKEEILETALTLFAERGYTAVSTNMIAEALGITKGALYRHFESKQQIFDTIIAKMIELDAGQANQNHVPEHTFSDAPDEYGHTSMRDLCSFVNEQLTFWTGNDFAARFRRMLTIEQFRSSRMTELYQSVIVSGPLRYTEDVLRSMLQSGWLTEEAEQTDIGALAVQLYAPLKLSVELCDGGADISTVRECLKTITGDFQTRWMKEGEKSDTGN